MSGAQRLLLECEIDTFDVERADFGDDLGGDAEFSPRAREEESEEFLPLCEFHGTRYLDVDGLDTEASSWNFFAHLLGDLPEDISEGALFGVALTDDAGRYSLRFHALISCFGFLDTEELRFRVATALIKKHEMSA